ncbi:MAG: YihY/virulence factor BrkB family protein [Phenylobacterium sp.]|nr:YihY/virulence factor BrkB family protein [Phenylobacterium sp.]MBP7818127.1 YihY/virulence factor BrkB family protein [Phenylobacterium sp.]MBP9230738.1 YihY/virulence factor BrkB family protein [Phenylobacterium sp.]
MSIRGQIQRLRDVDWDPLHWVRRTLSVNGKALTRLWGRDVMLYVGGVSFFVLLAVFPGLAIMVGIYSFFADASQAASQAEALAHLMPPVARSLFENELTRLAHAPLNAVSAQSMLALVIGSYAAHRGFKALLAGLSFIHDEPTPRGFVGFNVMALLVLIAAFVLLGFLSAVFFYLRFVAAVLDLKPLAGAPWLFSEWTWASFGITLAMSLIYRFAMSSRPVAWKASITGGVAAALLCLFMSWASAFYVEQIVHLGATYGSVAAVVVFLIWLSWSVNAVFFGGALATEIELAMVEHRLARQPDLLPDLRGEKPKLVSGSES